MATNDGAAVLHADELALIFSAMAAKSPRDPLLRVVNDIASRRMQLIVFSVSACHLEQLELERIFSSLPGDYPLGNRKSKRETAWARHVVKEQKVFIGEGPLEMAAAFDDQERMASLGIRSIINVPIVLAERCVGVLNFGRASERVPPADAFLASLLGLVATAAFLSA